MPILSSLEDGNPVLSSQGLQQGGRERGQPLRTDEVSEAQVRKDRQVAIQRRKDRRVAIQRRGGEAVLLLSFRN